MTSRTSSPTRRLQLLTLVSLCILASPAATEAGIMTASMEPIVSKISDSSGDFKTSTPSYWDLVQGSLRAFGMSCQSSSSIGLGSNDFGCMRCSDLPADQPSKWFVRHCQTVVASSRPISLLKVPIEITWLAFNGTINSAYYFQNTLIKQ